MPLHEELRITVRADAGGKLKVDPDPAIARAGTPVEWEFVLLDAPFGKVSWEVYFSHTKAFPWEVRDIETPPLHSKGITHRGVLRVGPAMEPGDHKYGVRFYEVDTGKKIGDDDPRLVVLPGLG